MSRASILRASLDVLYYSGISKMLSGVYAGVGAIFMLHHIRPGGGLSDGFAPNAGLEITPEFLEVVIRFCKARGYRLVSLAEAVDRLRAGHTDEPFATFTIDDGYRDNLEYAQPVFKRHDCPFTIFIAPAITDGRCELWWRGLEDVIAGAPRIATEIAGEHIELACTTDHDKQAAFERLYWPIRHLEEHAQRDWIAEFCSSHGVDLAAMCRAKAMTWDEVRTIASDPLCTIGAHTVNHFAVARLKPEEAVLEAVGSRDRIAEELGQVPEFFAYPYGDESSAGPRDFRLMADAGFTAAVTTRKGLLYEAHKHHLTALPRVSLNGDYQDMRYVEVLLGGSAFALWNRFRKVNVA